MSISFLTLEEVLMIHGDQIERYGGDAGLRDPGLLRSALAMPCAGTGGEYFQGDVFEMAAAYLFHLVQNHAFIDGNKRTGTAAAIVFLDLNGVEITAATDDLVDLVVGVTLGERSKAEVAGSLRRFAHGA